MKLVFPTISRVLIIGVLVAVPYIFANPAIAQNQNTTPSMVINMSDHSIKVGNITSNETLTFPNSTTSSGNSTS